MFINVKQFTNVDICFKPYSYSIDTQTIIIFKYDTNNNNEVTF